MSTEPDDLDARAAEYVLCLLPPQEMAAIRRAIEDAQPISESVAAWETRLSPLAIALEPVPPPVELWQRIEAAIDLPLPTRGAIVDLAGSRMARALRFWRASAAVGAALAASLAFVLLRTPAPLPHYAAAISPLQGPAATWLAETRGDGALVVTALAGGDRPSGKDLELWALAAGSTRPVSLGVLPPSGVYVVAAADLARDKLQLLVSLEPQGGSPTGQPTGPVLYGGALTRTP